MRMGTTAYEARIDPDALRRELEEARRIREKYEREAARMQESGATRLEIKMTLRFIENLKRREACMEWEIRRMAHGSRSSEANTG